MRILHPITRKFVKASDVREIDGVKYVVGHYRKVTERKNDDGTPVRSGKATLRIGRTVNVYVNRRGEARVVSDKVAASLTRTGLTNFYVPELTEARELILIDAA